jgi:aminobenzoyl-glutamate transport protein
MSRQTRGSGIRPLGRLLDAIEWAGNKLPSPATLFALLALSVVVGSAFLSHFSFVAVHPASGAEIRAVNILSGDGLRRIITSLVSNFVGFAPLGTVLVALLGVGVAEGSGFLGAIIRALVLSAPRKLITPIVVFAGILSNAAAEAGYVILIPLAAVIFRAVGRHPLAGIAAAFAGVSGGYSANLVLGTIDPLLAGITQEAARILDEGYRVNPAANYYIMAASTAFLVLAGSLVTNKIVEPRLGAYSGEGERESIEPLSSAEKKGLRVAGATITVMVGLILWGLLPDGGILRDPKYNDILHSPFLSGIVAFIFVGFLLPGIAYGLATRSITSEGDIVSSMNRAMGTMGSYIVLVFFAAQFVAFFGWTNIGLITAIQGAEFLKLSD